MKPFSRWILLGILCAGAVVLEARAAAKQEGDGGAVTVITSDRLTFDYKNSFALFEHNVLVTDPEMQLASDKLTVMFDGEGKAKTIKAEGRVTIKQEDKTAHAGVATYDLDTGKIVLAERPRILRGRDLLEGELITYWRDDNRMICQPNARLVIYPEQGGMKDVFLGD